MFINSTKNKKKLSCIELNDVEMIDIFRWKSKCPVSLERRYLSDTQDNITKCRGRIGRIY